ncbi:MAG: DEAD/DEAH box helicase [Desulfobacterales bacterium]|nr:MAG: DEAD/DEAH box helicase [Desulfobacterales bacterium]
MLNDNAMLEPIKRPEEPNFLTQTSFETFDLPTEILAGLKDAGFTYCTPIQAQILPIALAEQDVAGQAQTGTGKTAAFLVSILAKLLRLPKNKSGNPSALIVAPTRELATQIYDDARLLGGHTHLDVAKIIGGLEYRKQAKILRQGTDIIIGTPGRIIDYFKQGILKTTGIKTVVIDEADRLLDLGFAKDMRYILRKLPHYSKRLSMLFSATLTFRVMELTYDYMNMPEFVSVTPEEITVEGIEQRLFHVSMDMKLSLLLGLLKREKWNRILIFANTKVQVAWLALKLKGNGWPAEAITGDLHQSKRLRLMSRFKEGKIKILVATDVASRGIHVEDISHVVNYDLPQYVENYIHRIGRTARAGKTGKALSLACEKYVFHLEPLEDMLDYKIPVVWPEDDWFVEDRSKRMKTGRKGRKRKPIQRGGRKRKVKGASRPETVRNGKPKSFPGSFFGFAPKPETENNLKPLIDEKQPQKKKGRRSSGKKKHHAGPS